MPQDTFVNQLQRIGTDTAGLAPPEGAVILDGSIFTVADEPDAIVMGPRGESIVGASRVSMLAAPAAQAIASLAWHQTTVFATSSPDVGAVLFRNSTGATIQVSGFELWPRGSLTANDTNYASVSYTLSNLDGTGIAQLGTATISTKTGGSGGTGNWALGTKVPFPTGPFSIPAAKIVGFILSQHGGGGGVNVPAFDMIAY